MSSAFSWLALPHCGPALWRWRASVSIPLIEIFASVVVIWHLTESKGHNLVFRKSIIQPCAMEWPAQDICGSKKEVPLLD